jgi:hypothetical protein
VRLNHESRHSWTDPQIGSPHAGIPHTGKPAAEPPVRLLALMQGGELVENYISTPSWRKDGEARHRVMFDADHLTLECASAMVLSLYVMDEPPMRMAKPTFRQASTATSMSMLCTSFRHHDRVSTVHQLGMLTCGTANTVSKLPLSGTHPNLLILVKCLSRAHVQPRPYTL